MKKFNEKKINQMGKTIIVPGADFSAVKVETIDVPRELTETTEAWVTASGNAGLTATQKLKLDDLVLLLQSGLGSKLSHLYLPMLAADKDHTLINYLAETLEQPTFTDDALTNWNSKFDFVPDTNAEGTTYHGIHPNDDSAGAPVTVDATHVIDMQNCTLLMFHTKAYDGTVNQIRGGLGNASTNGMAFYKNLATNTGAMSYYAFNSSTRVTMVTNDILTQTLTGVICNSTTTLVLTPSGVVDSESPRDSGTLTGLALMTSNVANRMSKTDSYFGAFIVGDGTVTESEALALQAKISALFAAINV